MPIKTIIMGAAGRDFHNFNTFFRGNKDYEVVAFTATQIPDIEGRLYPHRIGGRPLPQGHPHPRRRGIIGVDQEARRGAGHLRLFGCAA